MIASLSCATGLDEEHIRRCPSGRSQSAFVGSRKRLVSDLSGTRTRRHIRFEDQKQSESEVPAWLWTMATGR